MNQLFLFGEQQEESSCRGLNLEQSLLQVDIISIGRAALKKWFKKQPVGTCYVGLCPTDHQEKTPSFFLKPIANFYICYGCGVSGGPLALPFIIEQGNFDGPLRFYEQFFDFNRSNQQDREILRRVIYKTKEYYRWTRSYDMVLRELDRL